MDWKRIKTILIIALIGINIILVYTIYKDRAIEKVEALDSALVLDVLAEKAITFDPKLLEAKTDIPNLNFKLQTYDLEKSSEIFNNKSDYNHLSPELLTTKIVAGKQLMFTTNVDRFDSPDTNDDTIEKLAADLIDELGFKSSDVYLINIGRTDKKTILSYGQRIDGYIITDAFMTIKYNNTNLIEFERVWYDVTTIDSDPKSFSTPEYAFYDFIGQIYDRFPNRERAIIIEDLSLVYQLRQRDDALTLDNLVDEGQASIYWQIKTSDGESYIVNAVIE